RAGRGGQRGRRRPRPSRGPIARRTLRSRGRGGQGARPAPPRALPPGPGPQGGRLLTGPALQAARRRRGGKARADGRWAEVAAAVWLMAKGWRILGFRLKTPEGEIDILA